MNDISKEMGIAPCAYAGLDMAIWDWKAKEAKLPLYKYGIKIPTVETSVTIELILQCNQENTFNHQGNKFKSLKIKLGSPDGIDVDKAMFSGLR